MPIIGLLLLFIAVYFVLHAQKTGRPQYWTWILLFIPVAGALAYIVFELIPEAERRRRARQAQSRSKAARRNTGSMTSAIDTQIGLAEGYERQGMWAEAISIYHQVARGPILDEPDLARRVARVELNSGRPLLALQTLDEIRQEHPHYQSQDAHLTYARALEEHGEPDNARSEYEALVGYFIGLEASTRYAMLLASIGEPELAKARFNEVIQVSEDRDIILSDDDKEWARLAKSRLRDTTADG